MFEGTFIDITISGRFENNRVILIIIVRLSLVKTFPFVHHYITSDCELINGAISILSLQSYLLFSFGNRKLVYKHDFTIGLIFFYDAVYKNRVNYYRNILNYFRLKCYLSHSNLKYQLKVVHHSYTPCISDQIKCLTKVKLTH